MDDIIYYFDKLILEPVIYHNTRVRMLIPEPMRPTFVEWSQPEALFRQAFSSYFLLLLGGLSLYFILASLSYVYFFIIKKEQYHPQSHPQPFKGQVQKEIIMSVMSAPVMSALTVPFIVAELRGYSKLYESIDDYGWGYFIGSMVLFTIWTDTCIYWIHRELHEIPFAYKYIHKRHHEWKVTTPYAAIAFHPVDGWLQSVPYHLFPFIFPYHKWLKIACFFGVQCWTISIHDGVSWASSMKFVNGAAHHDIHHSKFIYNYGQFFTFWDRYGGSFLDPFTTEKKFMAKKAN